MCLQASFDVHIVHFMQLKELKEQLENPDISYPDYYLKKFHAYEAGNLDWQAVCELEPATAATAVRVFKHDHLAPDAAEDAMRDSFLDGIQASPFMTTTSPLHIKAKLCKRFCRMST